MKFLLFPLLLAAAGAAHAADSCKYPAIAELPIKLVGNSLHPGIEGVIDGMPATMLVDTGASSSSMTMTGVQRRGLPLRITGRKAFGMGGETTVYDVRLRELTAGPFRAGKTMVSVIAATAHAPSYDAIIGAPFLLSSDMEVRLAEKKLTFFEPNGCADTYLGYWDEPSVVLPFIYDKRQGTSPNPHFIVNVNGKPLRAMIDTGAGTTIINRAAAERAGIDLSQARPHGFVVGIGNERQQTFEARFDSIALGEETIHNAELTIGQWDTDWPHDLILGADFLRAHRVLFAMKQRKVYIAYIGGDAFPSHKSIPAWLRQEAEGGNADAEMVLARAYGYRADKPRGDGEAWLAKAAAHGNGWANTDLGMLLMERGQYPEAAAHIRTALDLVPADRYAPFSLYQARVLAGQDELAKKELAGAFVANGQRLWPAPLVDFYLGKSSADTLLAEASSEPGAANFRVCEANGYMAGWYRAHGDTANAATRTRAAKQVCRSGR